MPPTNTTRLDNALALHPEPPEPGNKRKLLLGVVGHHFDRITDALERANGLLGSDQRDAVLAAEEAAGCDAECVTEQMSAVVVATGTAAKDSVMKLGLSEFVFSPCFFSGDRYSTDMNVTWGNIRRSG